MRCLFVCDPCSLFRSCWSRGQTTARNLSSPSGIPIYRLTLDFRILISSGTHLTRRFDCAHDDVSLNLDQNRVHFGGAGGVTSSTKPVPR